MAGGASGLEIVREISLGLVVPLRGCSGTPVAERAELAEVLRAVGVGEAAWPECVRERTTSGE